MEYSVNVLQFAEARASEIASLMTEVSSAEKSKKKTWFQNMPHHMRRRGASENPKRVPKNLRGSKKSTAKPSSKSKKHKKQPKDLKAEYASRSKPDSTWLENHIWHTKRFRMKTMWGYQLPIKSNDSKLGFSHNSAANTCMLQDLSYYCCIELMGGQNNLLNHLSVLTDSSAGHTFASEMFRDGSKEGHSFLYHPKSCPYKAIGPVSFIWKPVFDHKTREYRIEFPDDCIRRLWIWCHPSFHEELVQVLNDIFNMEETTESNMDVSDVSESDNEKTTDKYKFACKLNFVKNEQYFCKEKTFAGSGIKMVLRKNTLVRHRLIGPEAQSFLTQVLRHADVSDSSLSHVKEEPLKKRLQANDTEEEPLKKRLKVDDTEEEPLKKRLKADDTCVNGTGSLWWESFYKSEEQKQIHDIKGELLDCMKDSQSSSITPRSVIGLTVRDPRIELSQRESNKNSSSKDSSQIAAFLTPEVADSVLWEDDIRNEVTATKLSDQEINNKRSISIRTVDLGRKESRIPVIIIHQNGLPNGFGSGWDLIAPLGWSLEFWRSLQRKGCRPAGLRDIHFVNLEAGKKSFPCSFPDTEAGAEYEEKVRLEGLTEFNRRPKSKRPNFPTLGVATPFHMCWKTLVKDWEKQLEDSEVKALFPSTESLITKKVDSAVVKEYFVFRQRELVQLDSICKCLNKIPRRGIARALKEKLGMDLDDFVMSLNPQIEFSRSLVGLRIHCLNKGVPSTHSGIYLLSDEDMAEVRNNPQFSGSTEPSHKKPAEQKKCLERPQVDSLISVSSRKMIGYISEGGFSSLCGRGYGLGHCSSIAFMVMAKRCLEAQLRPLVLVREQHCFKYRVANVEIIENY